MASRSPKAAVTSALAALALSALTGCDGCAQPTCETVACGDEVICKGDICVQDVANVDPPTDDTDGTQGGSGSDPTTPPSGGGSASGGGGNSAPAPDEDDAGAPDPVVPPPADDTDSGSGDAQDSPEEELTAGGCPVSTVRPEVCSFEDENCDGENNEDLDCTFLASSNSRLWRVDPFTGDVSPVVDVDLPGSEVIFDIDTDVDGSLLATGGRSLYRIADDGSYTTLVAGGLPFNPNGLAVANDGKVFIANHDQLVGSRVVAAASSGETPELLERLDPWNSSGDCVIHKAELFISASGDGSDELVVMNTISGEVEAIGSMGAAGVMGMSSAFGMLFGLTNTGDILMVDESSGATTVLHTDTGVQFTGAANKR